MGLKLEGAYTTELQTVLRVAHALRDAAVSRLNQQSLSPITRCPHTVTDPINLPGPPPLLPSLLEAGFNHEIAASISEAYHLRAEELKRRIQESSFTACREIAELPVVTLASSADGLMKKLVFTFTELYLHRLEQWKEEIFQRIKRAPKAPTKVASTNSRTFNHEFVPLLEHFFEENPFPTHADKMFLAKKSNMEYRQIHVWFQNRRNRTKKEGKTLRKKPTYECTTKPLDKLYERMKGHMIGSDTQAPKPPETGSLGKTTENNMSRDAFAPSSPPHAFPSSYPPTCHYDPFPCKSGPIYFNKPEWRRVPDGKPPLPLSTSIDDLIEKFSHLNVRDGTYSNGSPKLQSHAATVAITVIPSRAPHPSLIVRKYSQPRSIVPLRPSVRAPVSCSKAFPNLTSASKPVTLVPLSIPPHESKLPGKPKIAPLPQRFPDRMRNTRGDTTLSESSSTPSSSPRLFSTDSESHNSSSSSVSTPTDVASIRELPRLFASPCRSPFDSPIHLCGLGNIVAISSSSVS